MSTETHPYRSAPFLDDAKPREIGIHIFTIAATIAMVACVGVSFRAIGHQACAEALDAPRRSARAEQSARLWARSAYGVDPWVRCQERACDVVVGKAAPFTLTCDTDALGNCRVGGGR